MSIERLLRQSVMPDRILLEVLYENPIDREIPEIYMDKRIEVRYTPKEEYDRAGSRDAIIRELDSDIVIFHGTDGDTTEPISGREADRTV